MKQKMLWFLLFEITNTWKMMEQHNSHSDSNHACIKNRKQETLWPSGVTISSSPPFWLDFLWPSSSPLPSLSFSLSAPLAFTCFSSSLIRSIAMAKRALSSCNPCGLMVLGGGRLIPFTHINRKFQVSLKTSRFYLKIWPENCKASFLSGFPSAPRNNTCRVLRDRLIATRSRNLSRWPIWGQVLNKSAPWSITW